MVLGIIERIVVNWIARYSRDGHRYVECSSDGSQY
jgi:hypothetical protein